MDKNDRKLKIANKYKKANTSVTWEHMLHMPTTKILISEPLKKHTNRSLAPTFHKIEVKGKISQENGPKAETDNTKRATGPGRRIKRG